MLVYILTETDFCFNTTKIIAHLDSATYERDGEMILDIALDRHRTMMLTECHMNEAECDASIKETTLKNGLLRAEISSSFYNEITLEYHKMEVNSKGIGLLI